MALLKCDWIARLLHQHHFGRLHHRCYLIALFQSHLIDSFTRDCRAEENRSHLLRQLFVKRHGFDMRIHMLAGFQPEGG